MNSLVQWMLVVALVAVLDVSVGSSGAQFVRDIGWAALAFVIAEVLWALWGLVQSILC